MTELGQWSTPSLSVCLSLCHPLTLAGSGRHTADTGNKHTLANKLTVANRKNKNTNSVLQGILKHHGITQTCQQKLAKLKVESHNGDRQGKCNKIQQIEKGREI